MHTSYNIYSVYTAKEQIQRIQRIYSESVPPTDPAADRSTSRERAADRLRSWLLCCTFMAQHGAASSAHGETPAAAQSSHGPGVLTCTGLRPAALRSESAAGFMHMCRVLDTPFSRISAEILLDLRSRVRDPGFVEAFNAVCATGGPDVAALFDRAVGLRGNGSRRTQLHEVMAANRTLAAALAAAADRVNAVWGGLYEGKLDCLRSTLCNPAFGVNSSGSCGACSIILQDTNFQLRLRRSVQSVETAQAADARTNKRVMSIDQTRTEVDSKQQQARAQSLVLRRLEAARDRWKSAFNQAMEDAASVVTKLRAAAKSSANELLESARASAAEVAWLQQSLAKTQWEAEESRQRQARQARPAPPPCQAHAEGESCARS